VGSPGRQRHRCETPRDRLRQPGDRRVGRVYAQFGGRDGAGRGGLHPGPSFEQVDLLGFSLGGFISQVIAQEEPQLVRKIILAGTGPAGGTGIDKVTSVTVRDMIKSALTFKHPEYYLFFTKTPNGRRAAREFLKRLKERTENRDKRVSLVAFATQLKAIHAWGRQAPADLSRIHPPVLVANGDQDKMVPSSNSAQTRMRTTRLRQVKNYRHATQPAGEQASDLVDYWFYITIRSRKRPRWIF
jgi:pimeloyl-ACP methyl ester carboxylesterase